MALPPSTAVSESPIIQTVCRSPQSRRRREYQLQNASRAPFCCIQTSAAPQRPSVPDKNEEKSISFVCSFEENIDEIDVEKMIMVEKKRLANIIKNVDIPVENEELIKSLVI